MRDSLRAVRCLCHGESLWCLDYAVTSEYQEALPRRRGGDIEEESGSLQYWIATTRVIDSYNYNTPTYSRLRYPTLFWCHIAFPCMSPRTGWMNRAHAGQPTHTHAHTCSTRAGRWSQPGPRPERGVKATNGMLAGAGHGDQSGSLCTRSTTAPASPLHSSPRLHHHGPGRAPRLVQTPLPAMDPDTILSHVPFTTSGSLVDCVDST